MCTRGWCSTNRQNTPNRPRARKAKPATIAWLVRRNRRVPYRGVVKNNTWLHHRVADSTCADSSPWD
jgi:hypothetical protein